MTEATSGGEPSGLALDASSTAGAGSYACLARGWHHQMFAFVGLLTPTGVLVEANAPALQRANLTIDDVRGKPFEDCYWWSYDPHVQRQLRDAIRQAAAGTQVRYSVRVRVGDGQFIFIDFMLAPLTDERGRVLWLVPSAVDVSDRIAVERQLRDSREQSEQRLALLESVYRQAPVGLCVLDRELRWVRINDRLAEMNGFPAAEHVGRTLRELLPEMADSAELLLRRVLETGEPLEKVEIRGQTPAQPGVDRVWVESFYPLFGSDGQVLGVNIVAQEVTELKAAEAARRRSEQALRDRLAEIESIYHTSPAGLCFIDRELRFRSINRILAASNGADVEGHVGRTLREVNAAMADVVEPLVRRVFETGEPLANLELVGRPANDPDTPHDYLVTYDPVRDDGRIVGVNCTVVDVTAFKAVQRELEDLTRTLEQRVAQRTAELERRNRQLRELALELSAAERQERQRIARVLHDGLQQSLAAAKIHTDLLERRLAAEGVPAGATGELRQLLEESVGSARHLASELAPRVLEDEGLAAALCWLGDEFRRRHHLRVQVTVPVVEMPELDREVNTLLYQAARELLFNVRKHAGVELAQVVLELADEATLRLTVSDAGQGADPEVLTTPGPRPGATGFGLPLIRKRIDLLGGRVEVDAAPRGGCRVTLVVPAGERVRGGQALACAPRR